jgi:TolB protein
MNPQRTKIAFLSDEGIENQLVTMNRDGSDRQTLTVIPVAGFNSLDLDFAWSPDGSRLIYMNQNRIYRINADGSGLLSLIESPVNYTFTECDWTAFPTPKIAARTTGEFIYNSEILTYDEAGMMLAKVQIDSVGRTGGPMFSPDGPKLLITRDVDGFNSIDGRQLNSKILVKNLATGATTSVPSSLKPLGFNDLDARFSPDGAKVIFTHTNNDGISPRSIWVVDISGLNRTKLFDDAEMPDWR